jgi:hypothetical protein
MFCLDAGGFLLGNSSAVIAGDGSARRPFTAPLGVYEIS